MSLAAPVALVLFAALPVLWVLHRRRRRPRAQVIPSLLFVEQDLQPASALSRGFDPELWLTLAAAGLLALGAAGPRLSLVREGRTVRVAVSGGAAAGARGYRERVASALGDLRRALGPDDALEVLEEPADPRGPRPAPDALLALAQAGRAAARYVLSDRAGPAEEVPGVAWVAIGSPSAVNAGIVAADLLPGDPDAAAFASVVAPEGEGLDARLAVDRGDGRPPALVALAAPAGGAVSATVPVPGAGSEVVVELRRPDGSPWADDLPADDWVAFTRAPLRVRWGEGLPPEHRGAVAVALDAILGSEGWSPSASPADAFDLEVSAAGAASPAAPVAPAAPAAPPGDGSLRPVRRLVLHPVPDGAPAVRAGEGADRSRPDPLALDLSGAGVDLVFAAGSADPPEPAAWLLWREDGERAWPVLVRDGGDLHLLCDPLRGEPPPVATPLWPLLVENVVRAVAGDAASAGYGWRRRGLLDPETSRLGALGGLPAPRPDLASRSPDRAARHVILRPWLLGVALLLLLAVWLVPWDAALGRGGRVRPPGARSGQSSRRR